MKTRVPPPNPKYQQFLSPYEPRIRDLALRTRPLVLEEAPDSMELIYDAYNAVATGYSFTGRPSDSFIHIAVYSRWVNLGFNRGSETRRSAEIAPGQRPADTAYQDLATGGSGKARDTGARESRRRASQAAAS